MRFYCDKCSNKQFCVGKINSPGLVGCTMGDSNTGSGIPMEHPSQKAQNMAYQIKETAKALKMSVTEYKNLIYKEIDKILDEEG